MTKPMSLNPNATALLLNCFAGNGARISVGLRRPSATSPDGTPIEKFAVVDAIPLTGDYASGRVGWQNGGYDLSAALNAGGKMEPVQLEFVLRGAVRLYSFRFE